MTTSMIVALYFMKPDLQLVGCLQSCSRDVLIPQLHVCMPACVNSSGVYLALRGVHIANNSNINIRNISQISDNPNGALQCVTDILLCCRQNPRLGEWYLPSGALVQGTTSTTAFYRSRGDNGEVFLNRPSGIESPTGLFCCEVPDGTNTNQTLCVNFNIGERQCHYIIVMLIFAFKGGLSTMASGSSIAGESYTLVCSAGSSEGTFQWLGPPDGRTPVVESSPRLTIISNATSSQLRFRPVQQSDNGSYSCRATTNGLTLSSEPVTVNVNGNNIISHIHCITTVLYATKFQLP